MGKDLGRAIAVAHGADPDGCIGVVGLDYDARLVRRKRLTTEAGDTLLVDLPETVSLSDGDALVLDDARRVRVTAAPEPLLKITGDLPRLAWHIGNRHTPCQIGADHLVIRDDHVLARMLTGLGASLAPMTGPFRPEGGAYGHGRTMGHSHGDSGPGHDPSHTHAHPHPHAHDHGHDH